MANQKKLQSAVTKFRKENPKTYCVYSDLISKMANFIVKFGAVEVTVGLKDGEYYEYANN